MLTSPHRLVAACLVLSALLLTGSLHRAQAHPQARYTAASSFQCKKGARGQEVARVQFVTTELSIRHRDGSLERARPKMKVYEKERLITKKGKATITLCSGSTLALNQSTEVGIPSRRSLEAKRGEVAVFLQPGASQEMSTPSAKARGTGNEYDVKIAGKQTTFTAVEGTLSVSNSQGSVSLKPDNQVTVQTNKAPSKPASVDTRTVLTWTSSVTWQVLTATGQLTQPERLAVDASGSIYVTDTGNNRVVKLSPAGIKTAGWGTPGTSPGQFGQVWGIALGTKGNVFVTDASNNRVQKFTADGQFVAQYGQSGTDPGKFDGPHGIRIDAAGNIYVADTALNRIQKLSPSGQSLAVWQTPGADFPPGIGPGQFDLPEDIAFDSSGNVYVADFGNNRVQQLLASGQPLAQWNLPGANGQQFEGPTDLAVDAKGNIFVVNSGTNRVQEISPTGKLVQSWGTTGNRPGEFLNPQGIALDAQGNIYVADTGNNRIQKLAAPGP